MQAKLQQNSKHRSNYRRMYPVPHLTSLFNTNWYIFHLANPDPPEYWQLGKYFLNLEDLVQSANQFRFFL